MATCSSADSVIEAASQIKSNATKLNTFVNGTSTQTVQLGTGDPTPVLRKLVADAQDIIALAANDAAETALDAIAANTQNKADKFVPAEPGNLAKLDSTGNLRDAGHAAEDFVPLLAYASNEALELAWQNRMAIKHYREWIDEAVARDMTFLAQVGGEALQFRQTVLSLVSGYDEAYVQHRLMQRLLKGTNPTSSTKPVLFVIAGQSNANGQGPQAPFDSAVDCGQFWSWVDGSNELKPIVDPIGDQLTKSSGWCSFAKMFFALTGRKVILLNIAKSGTYVTSVADDHVANTWADDGYGTVRTTRKVIWDSFVQAVPASSYDLGAILWVQGEYDGDRLGNGKITVNDYIDGTLDVFDWLRGSDMLDSQDCPILLGQIGYRCSKSTSLLQIPSQAYKKIIDAQAGICDGESIFLGFSTAPYYWWSWKTYMGDGVHYGTYGYELQGKMFARSAAKILGL